MWDPTGSLRGERLLGRSGYQRQVWSPSELQEEVGQRWEPPTPDIPVLLHSDVQHWLPWARSLLEVAAKSTQVTESTGVRTYWAGNTDQRRKWRRGYGYNDAFLVPEKLGSTYQEWSPASCFRKATQRSSIS